MTNAMASQAKCQGGAALRKVQRQVPGRVLERALVPDAALAQFAARHRRQVADAAQPKEEGIL